MGAVIPPVLYGGFHSHGGSPTYGWFISWKIPYINMDDSGVPLWLRKLPLIWNNYLVGGLEHEFYFPFHIWDVILPIWRTPSFFKMVKTHHQPVIHFYIPRWSLFSDTSPDSRRPRVPHREVPWRCRRCGIRVFFSPNIHREIHWEYCEVFTTRPGQRTNIKRTGKIHHAMNG